MNLNFTADEKRFREEVKEWLRSNAPKEPRPSEGQAMRDFDVAWQRHQFEAGWAGINWPKEYGGRGLTTVEQLIWYQEYAAASAPRPGVNFVGVMHAGPTLFVNGTDEQKRAHLEQILRGDETWCQGFSEPNAGSDLASLRTSAVIDGDSMVVSGQKIWSSDAHWGDFQELLVRTDPQAPKHNGISWLICDMRSPGISVRPIKTMANNYEFAEVFYDNVRVPLTNVVGGINNGWRVAMSTLSFERGPGFFSEQVELAIRLERLIELAWQKGLAGDTDISRRLGLLRAEITALQAMTYSNISLNEQRGTPGAEGSLLRVMAGPLSQRVARLSMEILGAESLELSDVEQGWTGPYLYSYSRTIGGGTVEIQRNIVAERLLGLPRAQRS